MSGEYVNVFRYSRERFFVTDAGRSASTAFGWTIPSPHTLLLRITFPFVFFYAWRSSSIHPSIRRSCSTGVEIMLCIIVRHKCLFLCVCNVRCACVLYLILFYDILNAHYNLQFKEIIAFFSSTLVAIPAVACFRAGLL